MDELLEAEREIDGFVEEFNALLESSLGDERLSEKIRGVLNGIQHHRAVFYFDRLNSHDLMPLPTMININYSMNGLNFPENLKPRIWALQRALIRRHKAARK